MNNCREQDKRDYKRTKSILWLWELQLGLLEAQEVQAATSEVKGGRWKSMELNHEAILPTPLFASQCLAKKRGEVKKMLIL